MAATTLLLYFSHCGLKPVVLVVWTIQQQNPIDNSACVYKRLCCVLVSIINLSALALTEFKSKPHWLLITFVIKLSFIHNFTWQCVNEWMEIWNVFQAGLLITASFRVAVKWCCQIANGFNILCPQRIIANNFVITVFFFSLPPSSGRNHHYIASQWLMAHLKGIYRGVSWHSERSLSSLMALWHALQVLRWDHAHWDECSESECVMSDW